ncbi:MAG TPA: GxxExxY protein [Holophagaceae bacterium]|nr:GxxExxY protein [Holophagaceae bacterium]
MSKDHHEGTNDTKATNAWLDDATEFLATQVVDASLKVYRTLGPGLLESAYEACLAHELTLRGLKVQSQIHLPLTYEGLEIEAGYRIDLLVGGSIILELKCVDRLLPIHEAQLITYLRLSGIRLGFLINFHAPSFKEALKRRIV